MREIFASLQEARRRGSSCVYCSVVETRGSTPQKAGAVMIVFPDGSQAGTLGGGCVEAEVRQHSLRLLDGSQPSLLTYTLDDNYGWDDGLICGGRMQFVAQPIPAHAPVPYFDLLADLVLSGAGCTEAVVLDETRTSLPVGSRYLFDAKGNLISQLGEAACPEIIRAGVVDLSARPRPSSQGGVAYLPILPRCRLVIVGAGHVGQAVADLARQVDFDVTVIDDRETYANRQRFPFANEIVVGDIGRTLKDFAVDPNTYCLIVTRGHSHDEEALYHLANKPARYLGMIGSRRKIRLIMEDLLKEGISEESLRKVHAPLGIDIGSQTVPEIAVSIVAQLIGHRNRGSETFPPPPREIKSECTLAAPDDVS
ncbi:MAG: XdhC/CoxI family protein [Planctomycetota bacterium]